MTGRKKKMERKKGKKRKRGRCPVNGEKRSVWGKGGNGTKGKEKKRKSCGLIGRCSPAKPNLQTGILEEKEKEKNNTKPGRREGVRSERSFCEIIHTPDVHWPWGKRGEKVGLGGFVRDGWVGPVGLSDIN